jgi:site-specific DNA recombinase
MASLAQQESQSLSQNVKLGLQYRYQQGQVQVNCTRFLGSTKDENGRLVIVPEQAETVKRIYRENLEGASMLKIARGLQAAAVLNGAGNARWQSSKIGRSSETRSTSGTRFGQDVHRGLPEQEARAEQRDCAAVLCRK